MRLLHFFKPSKPVTLTYMAPTMETQFDGRGSLVRITQLGGKVLDGYLLRTPDDARYDASLDGLPYAEVYHLRPEPPVQDSISYAATVVIMESHVTALIPLQRAGH